jgi:hypothetical protein
VIKLLLLSTHQRRSGLGKEKNKQWVAGGFFFMQHGLQRLVESWNGIALQIAGTPTLLDHPMCKS